MTKIYNLCLATLDRFKTRAKILETLESLIRMFSSACPVARGWVGQGQQWRGGDPFQAEHS